MRSRISSGSSSRQRSAVRRSCQTIARATARPLARSQSSVVSRWLVIPIASRSAAPAPASSRAAAAAREHALPDLLRVVLDPAGPRKVLRQLAVAAAGNLQRLVDDEARRARRALVDREDHEWRAMNSSVRRHASADASANSSYLRSKKLCGAPS